MKSVRGKNLHCDGDHCKVMNGEVRRLPVGVSSNHGNMILCRACFEHEMRWRKERIAEGVPFALPSWDQLKIYPTTR